MQSPDSMNGQVEVCPECGSSKNIVPKLYIGVTGKFKWKTKHKVILAAAVLSVLVIPAILICVCINVPKKPEIIVNIDSIVSSGMNAGGKFIGQFLKFENRSDQEIIITSIEINGLVADAEYGSEGMLNITGKLIDGEWKALYPGNEKEVEAKVDKLLADVTKEIKYPITMPPYSVLNIRAFSFQEKVMSVKVKTKNGWSGEIWKKRGEEIWKKS